MKDASKKAQDILRGYVESIKDEKNRVVTVTTQCYEKFAQGIRIVMPDVDEETIDQMYAASGFETGKYRGSIAQAWYEQEGTIEDVLKVIDRVLYAGKFDGVPRSLTDVMTSCGVKPCENNWDYQDMRYHVRVARRDAQRALDALVYADVVSKTAINTCGHVHIYLYMFK